MNPTAAITLLEAIHAEAERDPKPDAHRRALLRRLEALRQERNTESKRGASVRPQIPRGWGQ